jgi:hypothetical protein
MNMHHPHRNGGGISLPLGATLVAIVFGAGLLAWEWHAAHPSTSKHSAAKVAKAEKSSKADKAGKTEGTGESGTAAGISHHKHHHGKHVVDSAK